jgi:hypothetical protein
MRDDDDETCVCFVLNVIESMMKVKTKMENDGTVSLCGWKRFRALFQKFKVEIFPCTI